MDILLQQIINGLVLGSMYALVALGYTMVYGIINLINFAHGEVLMVGAMVSWAVLGPMQQAWPSAPGWLLMLGSFVLACGVTASLNFTIEKLAYKPLRKAPRLAPLITAIGVSILLQTLAMIIFKLGLFDTRWALILTYPTFLIPFCTWLLMGYFRSIPYELEECALIDGATRWQILTRIILPLAVPGLISAGIFAFTLSWNEFIYALTFPSNLHA